MVSRLYTGLLALAVGWSSFVIFGPLGIIGSALALAVLLVVATRSWWEFVPLVLIFGTLVGLLLPAVGAVREPARRMQCGNNLKMIALALLNYQQAQGSLPPPYIADKNGTPIHSWRVSLLSHLELKPLSKLYNFDEPWDSPRNELASGTPLAMFSCPSDGSMNSPHTNYVAVVGPNSAWNVEKPINFDDAALRDKASSTIMLIETTGADIPWTEPIDMHVDELSRGNLSAATISSKHVVDNGPFYHSSSVVNVAMADGSVHVLQIDHLSVEELKSLLTIGGCSEKNLGYPLGHEKLRINWANCFAFAALIIATGLLLHLAVRTRKARTNGAAIVASDVQVD